jgi:hypothetical protein
LFVVNKLFSFLGAASLRPSNGAVAAAGESLIAQETFAQVEQQFPNAKRRQLELKGKSGTVIAGEIARQ